LDLMQPFLQEGDDIFEGLTAEVFLLEVLCGLHSPILGETEVFGQFRDLVQSARERKHGFADRWQSRIQMWITEVKKIREEHLCGTGCQSYGSLLRKHFGNESQKVAFVGAGRLVQECLPWIKDRHQIEIWARQPQKLAPLFPEVPLRALAEMKASENKIDALVIAAPLSGKELDELLPQVCETTRVLDLRRDSESYSQPKSFAGWMHLGQFMSLFDSQRSEVQIRAQEAKKVLDRWRKLQESRVQVRPFGWDDLWT